MSIAEHFNTQNYELRLESDQVISSCISMRAGSIYTAYDFAARVMYSRTGSSDGGVSVTPFDQLDRESVTFFRDKLTELGGNPAPLPWATQKLEKPGNGKQLSL